MLQTRHEHGGRSLGHAMGARKRAGKSEKLLSAGIIHGPFLGAGGLPRPPAVMCRAESSARASRSGVSDGRLQVIIIAAAEAIMQCGWVVGGVQTHHIAAVCACLLARLSCLSLPCCAIRSELQSRLSRPKGGQMRAFSSFLLGSAWLGGLASRARAGDRPSSKRTA